MGKNKKCGKKMDVFFGLFFFFAIFWNLKKKSKKKEDQNQIMTMLFGFLGKQKKKMMMGHAE
jgi:hypothetical protein